MAKRTESVTTKRRAKVIKQPDSFSIERDDGAKKANSIRTHLLKNGLIFKPEEYEFSDEFVPADPARPMEAHTTPEMIECLRRDPTIELEARVIGVKKGGEFGLVKMDRESFLEFAKKRESKKLMEAAQDYFNFDDGSSYGGAAGALIGQDFTPLLGGPFNKQLYYRDYLRMISTCFFAYHHDPVARDIVNILVDFTMGRGYQVQTTGKDADKAQILWRAFEEANDLQTQMDSLATEMSIYGESMWWWLPDNQTRISFNPRVDENVPRGLLPRVRLIDPSNIAEVITVPEDPVKGVLFYVWLAPTQYQMWTDGKQPSTKFIYTQIPANQIQHFKVNAVSNEKRGRSDYFPALGYMKRLRDSVNYSLVAQQKASAWCIDTTVKGGQDDIDAYVQSQNEMGPVPPAGSEFVHTEAITRNYLSNSATGKSSDSPTFNWCLNMICMSSGIPLSYLGTHLSGANTRASALVSTEPVAKRFERRRLVYERNIRALFDKLMRMYNINADCDVIFPELITQDRSAKLRDLSLAQTNTWISHKRASELAAKELDIKDFDYQTEQVQVAKDDSALGVKPTQTNPLTAPGAGGQTMGNGKSSALTAPERSNVKSNLGQL